MLKTKYTHIVVFGLLNALNQIAALVLIIVQALQPKPLSWDPPFFFLALIYCLPIAIVINFTWLMVRLFTTNRSRLAFLSLNGIVVMIMALISLVLQTVFISVLKYSIPVFIVINGTWLIVTLVRNKKQRRISGS